MSDALKPKCPLSLHQERYAHRGKHGVKFLADEEYMKENQHTTPAENPFRARTLKHTIWNCINVSGGMPSRDIMRICGVEYDNLRPRITEIRNHFQSDDIIRTITQQEYGNQYGSSGGRYDLNGYELQSQYTLRNGQSASANISINYDIDDSILAGLSPDRIDYWNQMIIDRR